MTDVQMQPQTRRRIAYPPGIPLPHETPSVPVRDSDLSGSVDQYDADMSEFVPVMMAHGKDLNLKRSSLADGEKHDYSCRKQ